MYKLNQIFRQEEGVSALYMALVLFLLVGMLGIALDGSNAYIERRRMQNAADFAALAGARALALGGDTTAIDAEVDSLAIANGVDSPLATGPGSGNGVEIGSAGNQIDWHYTSDGKGVEVKLVNHYDPFFARIFGYEILTSTAKASAGYLPVVGVSNLLPLAINGCDCVNFDELPASLAQSDFASTVLAVYTIGNINDNSINYTLYLKNVDPTYPGNTANRPYYLFYEPDGQGTLTVYGNGTAHAVAQVVNVNGDGFTVDLRLSERTSAAPDGQSPACDGVCSTTTDWHYYPTMTGTLTGLPGTRYAGAVIRVTRRGASAQVGTNAHLKNPKPSYGSAAWLALDVLQQPSTGVTLNSTNQEAILNMLLLSDPAPTPTSTPTASCPLYPIALSAQTLNGATPGTTLGDIWNGVQAGNFGWLTWAGAPNVPTLVLSLTPPGNSQTYVNPNQPTDTIVSIGDWVQGSPGVSNASTVRAALDVLKTINITVPVWDQATGNGNNSLYRVANFAIVRITDYQLPNQNRITATFVGYATDCGGSAPPTATPTPSPTPSPTPTLTLPPSPSATATPVATGTTACLVSYRVTSDWGTGFTADVTITNQTGAKLKDWLLTWTFAGNQQITNLWNGVLTQTGASIRVNNANWNGSVNKGSTVTFGFQASYSAQNTTPTSFALNGLACNGGAASTATPSPTTPAATPTPSATPSPTPSPTVLPATAQPTIAASPTPAAPVGSCALDDTAAALNRYSLIVLDDLSTSSDVENRTFVGGNLISTTSANFAINVQGIAASEPMFSVVGNLVTGNPLNLNAGSLHLGGNRNNRPINFNGGGALVQDPTLFDTAITNLLQTATAQLAKEPANNGVSLPTGQPGPARFQVTATTDEGVAIFQVAAADLFGNNLVQQMELTPGAATTILINVTGTSVDWSGNGNMVGNFTNSQWRGRVLWNFTQATTINFRAHNFMGALLAPYAQLTTAANLDGAVAVRALTTSAEVHQPTFSGALGSLCETTTVEPPVTIPCQLAWLDWDGGLASTGELADTIQDPSQSGQRQIGEWVASGPTVIYDQQVANALAQWVDIPALVVFYDEGEQLNGYQICGFAEFTLTDYDLAALPPWLQGKFNPALVRGLTDPNAPDYGLRDLRFK